MTESLLRALLTLPLVLALPAAAQGSQPATAKRIRGSYHDVEVRDVVKAIVMAHPVSIVVPSEVRDRVTVDLDHDSTRGALEAVAAAARAELVSDEYGVWYLVPGAEKPAARERKELHLHDRDLPKALLEIAKHLHLQVVVAPAAAGQLPPDVDVTPGQQAFLDALPEGVVCRRRLATLLVVPKPAPAPGARFDFVAIDVPTALREIAGVARRRLELEPEVEGQVTMHLRDVSWRHALEIAAAAGNGEIVARHDGVYVVRPRRLFDPLGANEVVSLSSPPDGMPVAALEAALTGLLAKPVSIDLPAAARAGRIFVSGLAGPRRSVVQAIADALFLDVVEQADGSLKLQPPH